MKENKNKKIDIRVTDKEKELIAQFAAARGVTLSEFVRSVINEFIGGKTNGTE